jgi:ketosteroid isomerase-like protein
MHSTLFLCLVLTAGDPAKEQTAVRKVLDNQVVAWNKGDLEAFMAGYWKSDKLSFFSGDKKTVGWQATLDRYRKRYQADGKEMGKLSFEELSIELLGEDHALVRGRFRLQLGKESPTGIFTLVVRKLPEGWRIVHDHTSS